MSTMQRETSIFFLFFCLQKMDNFRRHHGLHMGRKSEYCPGRQQKIMPDVRRDCSFAAPDKPDLRNC